MTADPKRLLLGWPGIVVGLLLVVVACGYVWGEASKQISYDHYQRWVIGTASLHGDTKNPYQPGERERLDRLYDRKALDYVGPEREKQRKSRRMHAAYVTKHIDALGTPWLYSLAAFTASSDYDRDMYVWQLVSLISFAVLLVLLGARMGHPIVVIGPAVALLLVAFLPAWSDVWVGNVGRVQLALIAAVLLLLNGEQTWRRVLAGLVLGGLVVTKPNVVYILPVLAVGWLLTKQFRKSLQVFGGAAAGGAIGVGGGAWFFGDTGVWANWLERISGFVSSKAASIDLGNSATSRILMESFGWSVETTSNLLLGAVFLALVGGLWVARRALMRRDLDSFLMALGCVVCLVVSPLAWMHYFVLTIPLILWVLRPGWAAGSSGAVRWTGRALAIVAVLLLLEPLQARLQPTVLMSAVMVCTSAVLLLGVGLLELFAARGPDPKTA